MASILLAVCVHDAAVGAFNRPFFVPSLGAALRSFGDECIRQHPDNLMYQHPADYALYKVGTFDEESGVLVPLAVPERLASASDFSRE